MSTHDQEKRTTPGESTDEARSESSRFEYEETARSLGLSDQPRWTGVWTTEGLALGFGIVFLFMWLWNKDKDGWAALFGLVLLALWAVPTIALLSAWMVRYRSARTAARD